MPRKAGTRRSGSAPRAESLLRSINVVYDGDAPERVAHFRPTTKSVSLLKALAGQEDDRSTIVVAPYGTGKSIAATYLLHVVENTTAARDALRDPDRRLKSVAPDLAQWVTRRRRSGKRGLTLALSGYQADLGNALKEAALASMKRLRLGRQARTIQSQDVQSPDQIAELLSVIGDKCVSSKLDQVAIIWDEFGRHLEGLLAESRTDRLHEVQTLAEFVSRTQACPMSLGLLLHRSLTQYAGTASQGVRQEWAKIEGRFATLQYVDDSKEIYRLIADFLATEHSSNSITASSARRASRHAIDLGLFSEFGVGELSELLQLSAPLDACALAALPRFASRISQNERTVFGFLSSADSSRTIGLAELYDYFAPAMQVDAGAGGTHRQWVETESAISRAENELEIAALKCACVLGIGATAGRTRSRLAALKFALSSYATDRDVEQVLEALLERKLLLHRRHNDDVSVWHGADIDLRTRLREERERQDARFDLLSFLRKEASAPTWTPVAYNSRYSMRRYMQSEYHTLYSLDGYVGLDLSESAIPPGVDGRVLYVLSLTEDEAKHALDLARSQLLDPQIVIAICPAARSLYDTALELKSLQTLFRDKELLSEDPLVETELSHMRDDASAQLASLVSKLTQPDEGSLSPRWFHRGEELPVTNRSALIRSLSTVMEQAFPHTPQINNEMIVRAKPSAVIVNSRKKLTLGILERFGMESLGLEGNFPDSSMFRSVLLNTGLFRQGADSNWRFAYPDEVGDPNLKRVWQLLHDFFSAPSDRPKAPLELFQTLQLPPIGLRAGLLPIFFAAALRAFPTTMTITRNGQYLDDVLPSTVEDICRNPDDYRLHVRPLTRKNSALVAGLAELFDADSNTSTDKARSLYDAIVRWRLDLPAAARRTNACSENTLAFRDLIFRLSDPVRFVTEELPSIAGKNDPIALARDAKAELENITADYFRQALSSIRETLSLNINTTRESTSSLARRWASIFSEDLLREIPEGIARGFVRQLTTPTTDDRALAERLSGLLLGKQVAKWDDSTPAQFSKRLAEVAEELELVALQYDRAGESTPRLEIEMLLRRRMIKLVDSTRRLLGPDTTRRLLMQLADDDQGANSADNS